VHCEKWKRGGVYKKGVLYENQVEKGRNQKENEEKSFNVEIFLIFLNDISYTNFQKLYLKTLSRDLKSIVYH